jgi:hypothetical protein
MDQRPKYRNYSYKSLTRKHKVFMTLGVVISSGIIGNKRKIDTLDCIKGYYQQREKETYRVGENILRSFLRAGHWWLIPIILANQEAEIGRIKVQRQPGQMVCQTLPVSKKPITKKKKRLVEWLKVRP